MYSNCGPGLQMFWDVTPCRQERHSRQHVKCTPRHRVDKPEPRKLGNFTSSEHTYPWSCEALFNVALVAAKLFPAAFKDEETN